MIVTARRPVPFAQLHFNRRADKRVFVANFRATTQQRARWWNLTIELDYEILLSMKSTIELDFGSVVQVCTRINVCDTRSVINYRFWTLLIKRAKLKSIVVFTFVPTKKRYEAIAKLVVLDERVRQVAAANFVRFCDSELTFRKHTHRERGRLHKQKIVYSH